MPTAQKAQAIEQTREKFQRATGVLFTEYRGLKVSQLQKIRKDLKAKGGELTVIKNTLFRIAAEDSAKDLPTDLGSGPTAIAFIYENESECAKTLLEFAKTNKAFVVKGGLFQGKAFDAKGVEDLSNLPPRDVLLAQLIGTIAAPLTTLVGVIEQLYADPIRTVMAVADKANEGNESPVAAAPAEEPAAEAPAAETPASEADATPAAEEAAPTETQETQE
jgi:large subunit ribosomal protein L10